MYADVSDCRSDTQLSNKQCAETVSVLLFLKFVKYYSILLSFISDLFATCGAT